MLNSTQSLNLIFEQALLARAAYADLSNIDFADISGLIDRFSGGEQPILPSAAAEYLAERFGVLNHQPDTSSGYSGTLFARRTEVGSATPSSDFTFAIRGTNELLNDLLITDIAQIGILGRATSQEADMLQQFDGFSTLDPSIYAQLVANGVNVTGHSLGGHLATLFLGDRPNSVKHAYTFNGAGVYYPDPSIDSSSGISSALLIQLAELIGIRPEAFPTSDISNFIGDPWPDFISGTNSLYGTVDRIFQEDLPNVTGVGLDEHSLNNLIFGIASTYLLSLLDPTLDTESAKKILESVSNVGSQSYEQFAAALQRTFGIAPTAGEVDGDATIFGLIEDLEDGTRTTGDLISLVDLPAATLMQQAQANTSTGRALRYAMVNSLPFAIDGAGANAYLDAAYDVENFSIAYLQDRAEYLIALWGRNAADLPMVAEPQLVYIDRATNTMLASEQYPDLSVRPLVIFGSEAGDAEAALTGGSKSDSLYGGGGDDVLNGGGAADYLEGGTGNDTLITGTGADVLDGGTGTDTYRLSAGATNVTIRDADGAGSIVIERTDLSTYTLGDDIHEIAGSPGHYEDDDGNRYQFYGSDLLIQIKDGTRTITIENFDSMSGTKLGLNLQASETYTPPSGARTYNVGAPNQDIVQDEASINALGSYEFGGWMSTGARYHYRETEIINVSAAIQDPANNQYWPTWASGGMGDSYITGDAGVNLLHDDSEAHWGEAGVWPGTYGISPLMGNDRIDAGAGDDWVHTSGGDDTVYGGSGNDVILDIQSGVEVRIGETPNYHDYLIDGTEWIDQAGHSSNDQLFGDAGNDYIAAHGGNQFMDGGADNDELFAGAGDDVLIGGVGNDVLAGDIHLYADPFVYTNNGYQNTSLTLNGDLLKSETVSYGKDILDGGDGDDTLYGGGGDDILIGGAGNDRLQGDFLFGYSDLRAGLNTISTDPDEIQGNDRLFGGEGSDELWGGAGDDYLDGGADNDQLHAGEGNDVLYGGGGADLLQGDYSNSEQGDDEIHGGDGADTLYGVGGNDQLYGDAGNDILIGDNPSDPSMIGNDYLEGGDGDDILVGNGGDDVLIGGLGHDQLEGGDGNDRLEASSGGDTVFGDAGDDTIVVSSGAGDVWLEDIEGANRLIFGDGITADSINITTYGDQVLIGFGLGDFVSMSRETFDHLSAIEFQDGSAAQSNRYIIDQFYSATAVNPETDPYYNVIDLGPSVLATDIGLAAVNKDLLLTYSGSVSDWVDVESLTSKGMLVSLGEGADYGLPAGTEVLVVHNWYDSARYNYLGAFRDDGGTFTNFAVTAVNLPHTFEGGDGAEVLQGESAADTLVGHAGDDLLSGDAGNDSLNGDAGADMLLGGSGDDVYTYGLGDGQDVIYEESGTNDILRFGAGIAPSDIVLSQDGADVIFQVGASSNNDSIRILGWNSDESQDLERIEFADGTVWSALNVDQQLPGNHRPRVTASLANKVAALGQTFSFTVPIGTFTDPNPGDQLTYSVTQADGSALPSWLSFDSETRTFSGIPSDADAGTKQIAVRATDPSGLSTTALLNISVPAPVTLTGTSASESLTASTNDDYRIYGLDGYDMLTGAGGNDRLQGGTGNDTLTGGGGSDTYIYNLGDGTDTITATRDSAVSSNDVIQFGSGIKPEDVRVWSYTDGVIYLVLYVRDPVSGVTNQAFLVRDGFNPSYGQEIIDAVEFADGTVWSRADLYAKYFTGDSRANTIGGFSSNDAIDGKEENDYLMGGGGDDDLTGGAGNDMLYGDAGNDTFHFGRAQGVDQIFDSAGVNKIVLDAGIAVTDVSLYRTSSRVNVANSNSPSTTDELVLVLNTGEQLWIGDFYRAQSPHPIAQIVFADGTVWDASAIDSKVVNVDGVVDSFTGTSGDDQYTVDNISDSVNEAAGSGTDTITSSVSYTLPKNVENLTLSGSLDINGSGNELHNTIYGNVGANYLYGGSALTTNTDGVDTLIGGAGDDVYKATGGSTNYTNFDDIVIEAANEGYDTIIAQSYSALLPSNVEAMIVYSAQFGLVIPAPVGQKLLGNELDNVIDASLARTYGYGMTIDGGLGSDLMIGPTNPSFTATVDQTIRYVVDNVGDIVVGGNGTDIVQTSVSFALSAGIERIELTGSDAITATGNSMENILNGSLNSADNLLVGGAGNDTYILGAGDMVQENANEGTDSVQSALTYTLGANVENLTLTGTASVDGTGNTLNNVIVGNAGANILMGEAGNDQLTGAAGNDRYRGFGAGSGMDVITESSGADTIEFAADQNIHVEQLQFTRTGNDLIIAVNSGDSIKVTSWYAGAANVVEWLEIYDQGLLYTYSSAQMQGRADGVNTGPVFNAGAPDQSITTNESISFQLPANLFVDIESQHSLTYTITQVNGSALPAWLSYDSATSTFSGTPGTADTGTVEVKIVVTDSGGLTASTTFNIFISPPVMYGTAGDDVLAGTSSMDIIDGLAGNDTLSGLAGDDSISGSEGDDVLYGHEGFDDLSGGEGNDFIYGGADGDYLVGGNGNDYLDGGIGLDDLYGGLGNDIYVIDDASDYLEENPGEGVDEVRSPFTFTLGADFENLTLTGTATVNGTGNGLDNIVTGNAANNTLSGGAGNDTLDGGAGNDSMSGGTGNDIYVIDSASDTISESSNQGTDTVQSSVTWTLGSNFENLVLTGTSAINGTGNSLANVITGNGGNNTLSGGTGADTLMGGVGNDTYVVDNTGDVVTESLNEGTDLVQSSVAYTLSANVENLTLTGSSGLSATGNSLDNVLTGNTGNNTLTGGDGNDTLDGGSGSDTMIGGLGNDTYVVAQTGDVVTENSGEGTDLVQSSIAYTLGNYVENLTLTGSSAINGTGNTLDNILTGNSGKNTLTGNAGNDTLDGGSGTDTMVGGAGNDVYYVDVSADVTTENANEGIDLVNSGVTRTLASNIELLFLTGTSAINGTGNTLANLLRGNTGNNTLAGGGGTDILEGGAGTDTLSNTSGNTLLNGGAGTDTLTGTSNNDLLIGGTGNDALTTGSGADIIAFNKGDGQDTVASSTTKDNTLSIGGGAIYADLLFQKSGNNLILKVGSSDQITFTNYYASTSNRSVNKLQVVLEGSGDYSAGSSDAMYNKKIETFDFGGLVSAFDAALAANPNLTSWALSNALVSQYLSGSDTAAIGGDLAYQYGRYSSLSNISFTPALGILSSASFGGSTQTLQSLASLQDSTQRLS